MNAMIKVPLQFAILLTGALVFTFFVFERPPILFNNAAAQTVAERAPERIAAIEQEYAAAFAGRRDAARRWAESGARSDGIEYQQADARLQAVRGQAIELAEDATGDAYNDTNYIFLTFVIEHLPAGLVGLIIAAVFAAAMSTISAELNSLATASVVDHYARYLRPGAPDQHYAWVSRGATAFWGLYATIFAGFGDRLGSLIEAVNIVGSWFYGSMLGVFVLAFAPWRATGTGAFVGMLAGLAAVAWTNVYTEVTFLWFKRHRVCRHGVGRSGFEPSRLRTGIVI